MKNPFHIVRDTGAQALTEMAVVAPVVFFVFFASFQYVAMWNVQLMVDYAAFCAARVAATQEAHIGPARTRVLARAAAALALMPVSKPVQGEAGFYLQQMGGGSALGALKTVAQQEEAFLRALAKMYNQVTGEANSGPAVKDKLEWLLTAWARINVGSPISNLSYARKSLGGGLSEINLELRYDYPLYIPGFAEFWNFLTGTTMDSAFTRKSPSILFFFETLRSKCAVGYEDFSRNFENNPVVQNPYADQFNSIDQDRVRQIEQEIQAAQQGFQQAKQNRDNCDDLACRAFYQAQMDDFEDQIEDLREEYESIMPNI